MSFTVQINVALRERICQKIGSERVKKATDSNYFSNTKNTSTCVLVFFFQTTGEGIAVEVPLCTGYIHRSHLPSSPGDYTIGQQVNIDFMSYL